MTIDSHMHVGTGAYRGAAGFPLVLERDGLEQVFHQFDLSAGMVFSTDNSLVRDVIETIPRAFGLYWANPKSPGCLEEAEEYLDHPKFLGMKMHPMRDGFHPNDPLVHPLIELLIRRDMPVLIHCGHPIFSLPWSIEELVVCYPSAKIILGHMGHCNIVYINGALDVASRHANVFLETSGMPIPSKIKEAVDRVGADRVLYGSDVPYHDPDAEMLKIVVSGIEDSDVQRVLHTSADQLFFHGGVRRGG